MLTPPPRHRPPRGTSSHCQPRWASPAAAAPAAAAPLAHGLSDVDVGPHGYVNALAVTAQG